MKNGGCLSEFPQASQKHVNRWISNAKLPLGVHMCVDWLGKTLPGHFSTLNFSVNVKLFPL